MWIGVSCWKPFSCWENTTALEGHKSHSGEEPDHGILGRTRSKAAHEVLDWRGGTGGTGKQRAEAMKDH